MTDITLKLTMQEAESLLQVVGNTPMPYTVSHPLVQKIGIAITIAQSATQTDRQADINLGQDADSEPREHER